MKISPTTNLFIKDFAAGNVPRVHSLIINGVLGRYPDDTWFVEQRPGVNIFEQASVAGAPSMGRGFYYWSKAGTKYIINNDTVYISSYIGSTMLISPGTQQVYVFEVGDFLVILDPENNEGWSIALVPGNSIAQIVFPTGLAQIARGGVSLNGKLYVYDTDGDIYESAIEDPTTWNPLDFRNSEVEQDGGVFLTKHHQHVVAVGNRSMEFFYDAGNPTGSTLNPRNDIYYDLGAVNEDSFWTEGDVIFFIALSPSGGVEVHALENFSPSKISTPDIDSFLGSAIITDGLKVSGSGFRIGGRMYYMLTLYNLAGGVIAPVNTMVYNARSQTWTQWELEHPGIEDCPIVDWGKQTTTRTGEGILANGDLVTIVDDNHPQDTIGASAVYEPDVFEPDVFTATGSSGLNINWQIIFGTVNFGTSKRKFQKRLRLEGTPTKTSQTATIQWSNDADDNFNAGQTLDLSKPFDNIRRMGKFQYRNFRFLHGGSEQYRLSALDVDVQ